MRSVRACVSIRRPLEHATPCLSLFACSSLTQTSPDRHPSPQVPDILPFNARTSLADTFELGVATVQHTGHVAWSRPGVLDIMCKFSGLVAFPFDTLECGLDMGGWMISGAQQGIRLRGFGYDFRTDEATAGTSYQEFSIKEVEVDLKNFEYAMSPLENWPVVHYQLKLERAIAFYVYVMLFPSIMLTAACFAVLFVSPDCGERLGYGITIILAMEVYKVFGACRQRRVIQLGDDHIAHQPLPAHASRPQPSQSTRSCPYAARRCGPTCGTSPTRSSPT